MSITPSLKGRTPYSPLFSPLSKTLSILQTYKPLFYMYRPGGTRTPSRRIWSPVLCQLSYRPILPPYAPYVFYRLGSTSLKPAFLFLSSYSWSWYNSCFYKQCRQGLQFLSSLLQYLGYNACTNSPSTLSYCKTQFLLHGYGIH